MTTALAAMMFMMTAMFLTLIAAAFAGLAAEKREALALLKEKRPF